MPWERVSSAADIPAEQDWIPELTSVSGNSYALAKFWSDGKENCIHIIKNSYRGI